MKYEKVKVKKYFNLEEMAKEYEISEDDFRDFHNAYCKIHEFMPRSLPYYLEYVYIPIDVFQKRISKLVLSKRILLPDLKTTKKYGVVIKYVNDELTQIHFEIDVEYRNHNQITVNRRDVYVNDKKIDLVAEQFMEVAQRALFPIALKVFSNGDIHQIINTEEISSRWINQIQPKLTQYYKSEFIDKTISKLDAFYHNIPKQQYIIKQNLLFGLFFLPIYQNYASKVRMDISVFFSTINENITYDTEFSLEKEYSISKKILIRVQGKEQETYFNKKQNRGEVELLFKLHHHDFTIFSITGFAYTYFKNVKKRIEFELYELKN